MLLLQASVRWFPTPATLSVLADGGLDMVAIEVGEDVGAAVADGPATERPLAARLSETIAMPPTINPRISNPSTIHPTRKPVLRGSSAGSASIGVPTDSGRSRSAIRCSGSPSELIHHPT
jgi:hypothetical protein